MCVLRLSGVECLMRSRASSVSLPIKSPQSRPQKLLQSISSNPSQSKARDGQTSNQDPLSTTAKAPPLPLFQNSKLKKLNMKLLPLLTLASSASAWTFVFSGGVRDGTGNKGCTAINHARGQTFEWDRGFFSDCCIHLYDSSSCSNEVGISCPDWKKTASRDLKGFRVTNC